MERSKGIFQSTICFSFENEEFAAGLAVFASFNDEALRNKTGELLHLQEAKTGAGYRSDIRRRSFLHGRIAGKLAANQLFPDIPATSLHIATGILGAPYFKNLAFPYGISLAHDDKWNAGLCFPLSVPMGIDMETITEKNREIIPVILSDQEKEMCSREEDSLELFHLLWTAKEAAGKAIGLGFRVPAEWYEIDLVETICTEPSLIRRSRFKHLSVYTALSIVIHGGMLSVAFPAEQNLDREMIRLFQYYT